MDQTDMWMLGVAAFGVAFYLFSLYFHKTSGYQQQHGDEDHE
ncbi:MAG: hypothetical protein P8J80_02305 [Porticoccaceae bacterium]|nr:hypothetical protein [Porticoccaceae bacterium]